MKVVEMKYEQKKISWRIVLSLEGLDIRNICQLLPGQTWKIFPHTLILYCKVTAKKCRLKLRLITTLFPKLTNSVKIN